MEYLRRKCVWCRKLSPLSHHTGDLQTFITCLENAKSKYRDTREIVLNRCKRYRDNNVENNKQYIDYIILILMKIYLKLNENILILNIIVLYVFIYC